jgi:hypothetical protein
MPLLRIVFTFLAALVRDRLSLAAENLPCVSSWPS